MFQRGKREADKSQTFVFCEKTTGVAQFRAESDAKMESVDHVAGLLAMQCLVRGQEPSDFQVLVPAQTTFAGRVVERARELLEEGRSLACPTSLSPRQREILHSVLCNLANKEIASKLNITVRTVKFHISTLLMKFGVSNRLDLARKAAGLVRPGSVAGEPAMLEPAGIPAATGFGRPELAPVLLNTTLRVDGKVRTVRFPARILTA